MNINKEFIDKLICPIHGEPLVVDGSYLVHRSNGDCKFPIVGEVPVLINEDNSIFKLANFIERKDTTWKSNKCAVRRIVRMLTPSISHNLKSKENFEFIKNEITEGAHILVVGGSVKGSDAGILIDDDRYNIVSLDVCFSELVDIVGDGHDIPFESNLFDVVIIQSVLEHVIDPFRCVEEIHRVLKNDGIVYAETPFIQQVHMKAFDFTRFTHSGHRRLFRFFEELKSGTTGGPGMALAWSYRAFIRSFSDNASMRSVLTIFAHWTSFYLKYFDYLSLNKRAAYEGASSCYFIGKKSKTPISDSEIIDEFRGVNW